MGFDFSNFNKDGEGNFSDIFKKKDVIKGNFDKKKFKKPLIILGIIVVVIILAIIACNIYLEAIQYNEIGNLSSIYFTNLKYKVIFSVLCFILIFVLISVTNMFINKNMRLYRKERGLEDKKYPNYIIAAIFAFIGALVCKDLFYDKAISFLNAVDFGKQAPVIGKDIGYFIFQRPFFMVLYDFISTLWILVIIYTVIYYLIALTTSMNLNGGSLTLQDLKIKTLIRHNIINIAIFFIIKAVSYKFQREGIVYSNVVGVKGASYVDVHIWLNYFTIAPFLLLAIVVAAFLFIWKGKLKRAAISIAVFPAVWLLVTIGAAIYQGLIVSPNIISYENNYIKNNMQETRQAYGIDNIKTVNFQNMGVLNQDVLNKNQDTVNNIRVVDYQSTLESDTQLQSIKTFYDFHDGDIINYNIGGKDIPIFISAREIDKNKLPDNANTYVNRTFRYTHGYGVVVNPINTLAHEGQVNFLLNGLDMKSSDMTVKQPRIYYGEMTNDDVIANANGLKEIDYDGSKDTTYTGKGGIKLNLFNRLLFALRNQDFNMLVSGYVSSDSKLLINRNIITRAQKAVPFLTVDQDPYMLLTSDGRLKWILDAYTTSDYYPYSQDASEYGSFNYIRNSVKIVIDAYDGSVSYYIIDKNDPIVEMYNKAYPGLFSKDPLPADIASHLRYPELLFKIQSEMLRRYHLDPNVAENPQKFYDNQDKWDIPQLQAGGQDSQTQNMDPYYNMVKMPGGVSDKEELVLMRPFTPSNKNNMTSWLSVRSNTLSNYGQLVLFSFSNNTNIYGPNQVQSKINQIEQISSDMTLWGQRGSSAYMGNLLVIPVEDTVLYVEPVYVRAEGASSIPEVKEIVVGYQDGEEFRYGIGTNLNDAISKMFPASIPAQPNPNTSQTQTQTQTPQTQTTQPDTSKQGDQKLYNDIRSKYDEMKKQLDELGKLIDQMKQ